MLGHVPWPYLMPSPSTFKSRSTVAEKSHSKHAISKFVRVFLKISKLGISNSFTFKNYAPTVAQSIQA